jgi:ATP-dependent metalloprotease
MATLPEKDMLTQTKKNIEATIDVALGGRAAEEVFLGKEFVTTGCSSDLQNATNMAYAYVRDLGMREQDVFINQRNEEMSQDYRFKVDMMVQKLLQVSFNLSV